MDIPILFEDHAFLVINKPSGLLVHPTSLASAPTEDDFDGPTRESLISWLGDHYPEMGEFVWPEPSRPGIVHRLDRDTSGVMLIAKNPETLTELQHQFHDREVNKKYLALVVGHPTWDEHTLKAPVARSQGTKRRAQYLKLDDRAKDAETRFIVQERYGAGESACTLVEAQPKTGRTHQIRVHLGLLEHPILGDPWYRTKLSKKLAERYQIPRLMLHAAELTITHPETGERQTFSASTPVDYQSILDKLTHKK